MKRITKDDSLRYETITFWDLKNLMDIRNGCSKYMTNFTGKLNIFQQIKWYFKSYRNSICIVELVYLKNKPIGYSLRKYEDKTVWITGGLLKQYRGHGYGRKLFEHLSNNFTSVDVRLEVRADNKRAYNLYRSIGFVVESIDRKRQVIFMKKV